MIREGFLDKRITGIFIIFFITFFFHLNAFFYNPRTIMFILFFIGILFLLTTAPGLPKAMTGYDLIVILTLVIMFKDNWTIKAGSYDLMIMYVGLVICFMYFSKTTWWIDTYCKYIVRGCAVLVFFTVLFVLIPPLKMMILPIVFPGNNEILETTAAIGLAHHYSANGSFMAISLGAMFWLLDSRKKTRIVLFSITAVCLLLTLKRGPLMWAAIALLISYYVYKSDQPLDRIVKILGLGILAVLAINILSTSVPQVKDLLARFNQANFEGSDITFLSGRETLYAAAWSIFKENPWFGVGWGGYSRISKYYGGTEGMGAHNIYLQLLAETGIVGTTIFMLMFIVAIFTGIRLLSSVRKNNVLSDKSERQIAFFVYFIVYDILYGMSGLVLSEVMLISLFMISFAGIISIKNAVYMGDEL